MNKRGIILSLEGGEGSGKTTLIKELAEHLKKEGRKVRVVREPGGSEIGEKIRNLIVDKSNKDDMDYNTELLLFVASRMQLLKDVTLHELSEGTIVIYDRYIDSSIVYQGIVRGLGVDKVIDLHKLMMPDWFPDYSILMDVDAHVGLKRGTQDGVETNKFEDYDISFHEKINEEYRKLFNTYKKSRPDNFEIIDANKSKDEVFNKLVETVERFLDS